MRLHSLHVRNYRIHDDLQVSFDPSRTLIGGRNETGKSTLVEAAHRALFLSHRRSGQDLESMKSEHHAGHPEVELDFEAGGIRYHLKKRFGGASKGSAELTSDDHGRWTANEAEAKLAELLGLDGPVAPNQAGSQWAHLWIRQGLSGTDPSIDATAQKDALLARLQEQGGAVVMQSDRDSQVAARFATACEEQFTTAGKPRATSELGQAEARVRAAADALDLARTRADRLDSAARLFQQSQQTLHEAETSLRKLEQDKQDTDTKLQEVEQLQKDGEQHQRDLTTATTEHDTLRQADARIRSFEVTITKLAEALKPEQAAIKNLGETRTTAKKRLATAEAQLKAATTTLRKTRLEHELSQRQLEHFRTQARLTELSKLRKQVETTRSRIAPLKQQLAALPALDANGLEKLRKLEAARSNARSALDAMATGIEWTAGKGPVTIDGRELEAKQSEILSEETELRIGDTRIMIRPGGGSRLQQARQQLNAAEETLHSSLDHLGLDDLDAARACMENRQGLVTEIAKYQDRLDTLDPESMDADWETLEAERLALGSTIERLSPQLPDTRAPADAGEAAARLQTSESQLACDISAEDQAKGQLEAARDALELATAELAQREARFRDEEKELTNQGLSRDAQLEIHGDQQARLEKLTRIAQQRDQAKHKLTAIHDRLEALQADQLLALRKSIGRSLEAKQQLKSDADRNLASAKATLASDGTNDPYNDLAIAQATLERETETGSAVKRQADAVKRLAELFHSEQQQLADQFTAPLAEKITSYLRTVFGPGAAAKVAMTPDGFQGLELVRREGHFDFTSLSGGTREQLAAAVRLAIAELLAADHDGCLPLVFDDAFTHSDPERIRSLQRMLDLAATRGLQIIILSCTPTDYDTLGAKEIALQPPSLSPSGPAAIAST